MAKGKASIVKWVLALVLLIVVIGAILVARSTTVRVLLEAMTPPHLPERQSMAREVLPQNWDAATSERFHFISQGTQTLPIPYDWFLALEQPEPSPWGLLWPGARGPLTDSAYLAGYGFIPSSASPQNPDGLPIGFASTDFQNLPGYPPTGTAVGLTCAACHTGRLIHDGTEYLVEGGPATIDLQLFSKGLAAALSQTLISSKLPLPNQRFERFARNLLGDTYSEAGKAQLAADLESILKAGATAGDTIEVVEGFGRLDALNRIGNQVFSKNTGLRENYAAIDAPVNFPHIWTAGWFDWVQYDGSIMQPLVRNAGEAMGVHAAINMTAPDGEARLSSSIPFDNLHWIETVLAGSPPPAEARTFNGLRPPAWPDALGPIDTALAAEGQALYARICAGCHLPALDSQAIWGDRYFRRINWRESGEEKTTKESYLRLNIIEQGKIGTDPAQGNILAQRRINTAGNVVTGQPGMGINANLCVPRPSYDRGAPQSESGLDTTIRAGNSDAENILVSTWVSDGPMVSFALALGAIVQQVNEVWMAAENLPPDLREVFRGDRPNCLQAGAGYKARPLDGVWATAPFLHNGSVPTLDDLLRPADQRPRFVRLGDPGFDPVKVGLDQPDLKGDGYPLYQDGYFILDTTLDGNRNSGHAFGASADGSTTGVIGRDLSDQERKAIIEYLKTL